jgi:hypothetical protein
MPLPCRSSNVVAAFMSYNPAAAYPPAPGEPVLDSLDVPEMTARRGRGPA